MSVTAADLIDQLERSCVVAWNEDDDRNTEFDRLEYAAIAVEDYLAEQGLPRADYQCRQIAIAALRLTPRDLQSIEPWCPGHGDDADCEVYPSGSRAGCRDAGFASGT